MFILTCVVFFLSSAQGMQGITDRGVEQLAKACPQLEKIDLQYCVKITDSALRALAANCPLLHKINVAFCQEVTSEGLQILVQLPELKRVYLRGSNISQEELLRVKHETGRMGLILHT